MYQFYIKYWKPFAIILVEMERSGIFIDQELLDKSEYDSNIDRINLLNKSKE